MKTKLDSVAGINRWVVLCQFSGYDTETAAQIARAVRIAAAWDESVAMCGGKIHDGQQPWAFRRLEEAAEGGSDE